MSYPTQEPNASAPSLPGLASASSVFGTTSSAAGAAGAGVSGAVAVAPFRRPLLPPSQRPAENDGDRSRSSDY